MKWTLQISDEELQHLINQHPRADVENLLARHSGLPVHEGRYGVYGKPLSFWENFCPGIQARVQRIKNRS